MSVSIYKPNTKNSGCAFSFRYGVQKNEEPCLYLNAIQQYSWDPKSKTGNFANNSKDFSKNLKIKFNEFECGSILSCFKRRYEYNTFHSYEDNKTTVKISPWDKEIKISHLNPSSKKIETKNQKVPAFGISITRNGIDNFKISLEPGEVEVVSTLINNVLDRIIDFRIENQIENFKKA
jgi:hypothetical protein